MKNLRGRPRNISESGIVYLDSDGEDSDYSDSDVEPVFFPAAEFEFTEALDEIGENDVEDVEVADIGFAGRGQFIHLINALNADSDSDNDNSDNEDPPGIAEVTAQELHRSVIQYFGGTVQVRHIVHENFTQLQQQQAQNSTSQAEAEEGNPQVSSQRSDAVPVGEPDSEESGEPPSICESDIVIRIRVQDPNSNHQSAMAEQSSQPQGEIRGRPEPAEEENLTNELCKVESENSTSCEEGKASSSSGSSSLVPYPDLPDYASAGEDDDDDCLKASIPAPYKSPPEASSSTSSVRLNLKRKEPDTDESDDDKPECLPEKSSRKRTMESAEKFSDEEEDEETCNPMISDEECRETEEAFRGDRIGSTVYSERHVLKILMKWIEELPHYSIEKLLKSREGEQAEEEIEKKIQRLNTDFEEQMALLWDMSSETDVMNFLVENKIFTFISDTIERSACSRLTEIALGILANVISEPSIIEDFTIHDSSIQLVEKVVELCTKTSDVAVLVQVFSVLRRVTWYLKTVSSVKKWTDLLQSNGFLGCVNFIMSSSRNALLLGNVIMLTFTLLDLLTPDSDDDAADGDRANEEQESEGGCQLSSGTSDRQHLANNYEPFCKPEFVPSMCEALKELMKDPNPPNTQRKLTSTREKLVNAGPSTSAYCQTDDNCPNADDIDIPIPDGHVQQAIVKGLSALALLQKAPNGRNILKQSAEQVISVLLDFYRIFTTCMEAVTRSTSLEYFALSLHLLSSCHACLETVNLEAITIPITTASKLMSQEEKDKEVDTVIRVQLKDGVEFDSVSYIALVAHEYLASVAENFGSDCTLNVRNSANHETFFAVLDDVLARFNEETEPSKSEEIGDVATIV